MPKRIPLHRVLEDMRALSMVLLRERRFASNAGDVLLLVGVAIGDLEAKPMTAYKLADYVGMPRGTVLRRLAMLRRAGLVDKDGRRYTLTAEGRRRAARA
ncbi:helix-turn-helix domain-containing protein [Ralstonia pseudosolanacearum]|uniref:Helix-turn-helix domain-containing protein n=1 Tax=Ralstonia solanacearum TaxID=305 RepID=A0ABY6N9D8_RALSL|nr:helix-turn-helix domain-containing protein [Ralstonia sp. RS650]UZF13802.1 helix-turn-helix domain-containing protein [Ralstonia solanacearum]UZF28866.1 helix-turn-helix domain-containing protein [Ralstonia sp. RS650]